MADQGALPTALLGSLVDGACHTMDHLVATLGMTRRQVSDAAGRLVLRGYLERIEAGCYQLTKEGIAAATAGEVIKPGPLHPHTSKVPKRLPDTFRQRAWAAMRMSGAFTAGEVAMAASRADANPESNARLYIRRLKAAGYVVELAARQAGTRQTSNGFKRFRLVKNTGAQAPVYQPKTGTLFDYNTGSSVPCANRP